MRHTFTPKVESQAFKAITIVLEIRAKGAVGRRRTSRSHARPGTSVKHPCLLNGVRVERANMRKQFKDVFQVHKKTAKVRFTDWTEETLRNIGYAYMDLHFSKLHGVSVVENA